MIAVARASDTPRSVLLLPELGIFDLGEPEHDPLQTPGLPPSRKCSVSLALPPSRRCSISLSRDAIRFQSALSADFELPLQFHGDSSRRGSCMSIDDKSERRGSNDSLIAFCNQFSGFRPDLDPLDFDLVSTPRFNTPIPTPVVLPSPDTLQEEAEQRRPNWLQTLPPTYPSVPPNLPSLFIDDEIRLYCAPTPLGIISGVPSATKPSRKRLRDPEPISPLSDVFADVGITTEVLCSGTISKPCTGEQPPLRQVGAGTTPMGFPAGGLMSDYPEFDTILESPKLEHPIGNQCEGCEDVLTLLPSEDELLYKQILLGTLNPLESIKSLFQSPAHKLERRPINITPSNDLMLTSPSNPGIVLESQQGRRDTDQLLSISRPEAEQGRPGKRKISEIERLPSHPRYGTRIACQPCARQKLRCDCQRPCGRCRRTGREDLCVDRQHKRGRLATSQV